MTIKYNNLMKSFLLVASLILTNPAAIDRFNSIDSLIGKGVFILVWISSITSLFIISFSNNFIYRAIFGSIITLSAAVYFGYYSLTNNWLGFSTYEKLLVEIGSTPDAISFYGKHLIPTLLYTILGFIGILIPPKSFVAPSKAYIHMFALAPILLISGILYARGGEGSNGLPGQYDTIAFTFLNLGIEATKEQKTRKEAGTPYSKPLVDKIVLIIDESISGDLLDINSKSGVYSALNGNKAAYNFGVSSSISNCSSTSNLGMRFIVSRSSPYEDTQVNPSIWQYARNAGYKTIYIDAQRYDGKLQNYMNPKEKQDIDEFIQIPRTKKLYNKDLEAAEEIKKLLKGPGRIFILVNKTGAHFPYEGKYNPENRIYSPTMEEFFKTDDSAPDMRELAKISPNNGQPKLTRDTTDRVLNSYKNTLAWTVGVFFKKLLADRDMLAKSIIIYTSDHGQNLNPNKKGLLSPHCSPPDAAHPDEGRVPLILISNKRSMEGILSKAAEKNRDKLTNFSIGPTILQLMGYQISDPNETIFSSNHSQLDQKFLTEMIVRFGKKPSWQSIHN